MKRIIETSICATCHRLVEIRFKILTSRHLSNENLAIIDIAQDVCGSHLVHHGSKLILAEIKMI